MKALPPGFEEYIRPQLGNEYPQFLSSLQEPPPLSVRVHPVKNMRSEKLQPVPWTAYGQYLQSRPIFTLDPLFHGGTYYVQEASSMFLEQALRQSVDLKEPLNVLDLCGAPGGKSTHILSLINRDSLLVSNETIRSRAVVLSENIQKWGYPNSIVTNNDPSDFRKVQCFFDVVVVDAPCSGEGLFRKEPEAMNEWSPQNVQLCAARQKRIVADVWDALRENGTFIYCTCTFNSFENEDNIRWLSEHHDVQSIRLTLDPSWGVEEVDTNGLFGYHFYPHKTKGEGFFIAVMRKVKARGQFTRPKSKRPTATPSKKLEERLKAWIRDDYDSAFFQFNDLIFYTPSSRAAEIDLLLQSLRIMYAGTNVATVKHEKLVPAHAMALSVEINQSNFPVVEVNEEEALKYLRRENIELRNSSVGFTLLTHQHVPIGWVNVLANRVNNMYPSEWRIRMGSRNVDSEFRSG